MSCPNTPSRPADKLAIWASELQSIAQAGLTYGHDDFDIERYQRIRELAIKMVAEDMGVPDEQIRKVFCADSGYQTPKIDTRAAIIRDNRILLVQERDGRWAMPGGWCEYDLSPAQNTIKEAKEEAGLDVEVHRLVAAVNRRPPYPFVVVKMLFLCSIVGGTFEPNIETTASGWFFEHDLPTLAEGKTNRDQIHLCFEASKDPQWQTVFE